MCSSKEQSKMVPNIAEKHQYKLGIWPGCKFWFHLLGWCFCWLLLLCFSFCGKGSLYLCVIFDITCPKLVHHLFQGLLRGLKQLPLYKDNPCLKMHAIAQAHPSTCTNWLALNWCEALSCLRWEFHISWKYLDELGFNDAIA